MALDDRCEVRCYKGELKRWTESARVAGFSSTSSWLRAIANREAQQVLAPKPPEPVGSDS